MLIGTYGRKPVLLLAALILCALGAVVASSCQDSPVITHPPGDPLTVQVDTPFDSSAHFAGTDLSALVTQGYDTTKQEVRGLCMEKSELMNTTGGDAQSVSYQVDIVKSMEELSQVLNVSAQATLDLTSKLGGTAGFSLGIGKSLNQFTDSVVVRVTVTEQEKLMTQFLLKQSVTDKMQHDPSYVSSGRFAQECGDRFVAGYQPGGELIVVFSHVNNSSTEKTDFEANLSFKLLSFLQGNTSLKSDLQQKLGNEQTQINFYSSGTVNTLPTGLDGLLTAIQQFPADVAKAQGWPLTLRALPYTVAQNYPNVNSPSNEAAADVLRQLAELRKTILSIDFDCLYIYEHKDQFQPLDEPALATSLSVATQSLKTIEDAARKCYEQNDCELPNPLPAIPRKPVSSSTPNPGTEFQAGWKVFATCDPNNPTSNSKDVGPSPTMPGCRLVSACSHLGDHWLDPVVSCPCTPGQTKTCDCPECGAQTLTCTGGGVWPASCPCHTTCPSGFTQDGSACSEVLYNLDYQSWTCTDVAEGAIFKQIPVPAGCVGRTDTTCSMNFELLTHTDRSNSCESDDQPVLQIECENVLAPASPKVLAVYSAKDVYWGYTAALTLSSECTSTINFRKRQSAGGSFCSGGCSRYVQNLQIKATTTPAHPLCSFP